MIEPHVHCAACHGAIETTMIGEDGKVQEVPTHAVQEEKIVMVAPGQMAQLHVPRPICDTCFKNLEQRERVAAVCPPRLVVGRPGAVH